MRLTHYSPLDTGQLIACQTTWYNFFLHRNDWLNRGYFLYKGQAYQFQYNEYIEHLFTDRQLSTIQCHSVHFLQFRGNLHIALIDYRINDNVLREDISR